MAATNVKRKRDEDLHHDKNASSQKRRRSSLESSPSSVGYQPVQLSKSETETNSKSKNLVVANAASSAAIDVQPEPPDTMTEDKSEPEEDDEYEEDEEDHDDSNDSETNPSEDETEQNEPTDSDTESHPETSSKKKEVSKADNPTAFASSMAGILGYKLTRTQRANPILARSADAKEADETLLDRKLEKKAKAELRRKEKKLNTKGGQSIDDDDDDPSANQKIVANQQREKELRKMAQKGVVKMFNAFASVREKTAEAKGVVGSRAKKEEKVTEMSKEGWLEYIGQGGKGKVKEKSER